ncbi:hypothetical protein PAMP_012869 [Pampus punctatissimus]
MRMDVKDGIFKLDEGLELVVSHNPQTMQCVANLVLAVNRMKPSLKSCRELSDEQLCSMIMVSLEDENIVKTVHDSATGVKKSVFHRVNSVKQCTLCDTSHKDLVHTGDLKLQAITLKGGNHERKINFKLSRYITPCSSDVKGQTIVLSISNNLHISSSMKDGKAVLNLEECSEGDLQNISDDEDMDRFLFYRRTTGVSLTTFESVKCPGWFISTSSEDEQQPVEMCQVDTSCRITYFKLN